MPKRNEVTIFRKFSDPLAINTGYLGLIILVEMGKLSSVAIIIITREFVITGFRMLLLQKVLLLLPAVGD